MPEYMIQTNHLSKTYGLEYAVRNVNMHIQRGDIYGLIGPNGSGKTTLIKMLAGLIKPTEGEIIYASEEIKKKRIGMLLSDIGLYDNYSAYENMKFKALALGVFDKKNILEQLDMFGLGDVVNKKSKTYSVGMKQRLKLALTLVGNPDILILDEPIKGMDPSGIAYVRDILMTSSKERNVTTIMCSNVVEELNKVADVIGIMSNGSLVMELTKAQLDNRCADKVEIVSRNIQRATAVLEEIGIDRFRVVAKNRIHVYGVNDQTENLTIELVRRNVVIEQIYVSGTTIEELYMEAVNR